MSKKRLSSNQTKQSKDDSKPVCCRWLHVDQVQVDLHACNDRPAVLAIITLYHLRVQQWMESKSGMMSCMIPLLMSH